MNKNKLLKIGPMDISQAFCDNNRNKNMQVKNKIPSEPKFGFSDKSLELNEKVSLLSGSISDISERLNQQKSDNM